MKIKNHILQGADLDNQSPNKRRGTMTPTVIVLHYTASGGENGEGDASYLSRASSRASAQVVVGRVGDVHQLMPLNNIAWHAGKSSHNGVSDVNAFSIGIEIDNWGWLKNGKSHAGVRIPEDHIFRGTRSGHDEWEAYKPAQLDSVEEVIAAICEEYPIEDIVGHEDIAPGRKQDPGPALDEFMARMKEKYLGKKTSGSKKKSPAKKGTKKTTANLNLRQRPSASATILTVIPKGATVQVLSEWNGWSEVRFGKRQAFVSSSYLK